MEEDIKISIQRKDDGFYICKTNSMIEDGIYIDGIKITNNEEWNKAIEEFKRRETEYIHKSKIKEKIEELKEIADEDNITEFIKIDILQELLESEE